MAGVSGSMDMVLTTHLTLDRADEGNAVYNEKSVSDIISNYQKSISFSGLLLSENSGDEVENESELELQADEIDRGGITLGDYVQWESQGSLQFKKPMKVRWISDDGTHLAVEGSDTGIPTEQVTIQRPTEITPPPQMPPVEIPSETPSAGHRKAVFPVSEGDVTFIFPEGMSLDGIEELEAYLAVFLKKEKRMAES